MRIGVLGGTFDPIHYGHLAIAEECRIALNLDTVLFLPAGSPPHKRALAISPIEDRVAMVELAIATNAFFRLSHIDVDRPGPSYSVDSLTELAHSHGPGDAFWFLMGADSLADLLTWRDPVRLLELTRIVATNRPGSAPPDPAALEAVIPGAARRVDVVDIPNLAISGSDLRDRVAHGRPIKYQLPEPVEQYILQRGLYRANATAERSRSGGGF
ncbi:MAG: nicotinate-nucleotide adenylyltransferase [Chloroflexota bacterium]|nr:MAG: nicotinate-nucleotide adenylyltransferase [Chloroflexota bacterium]